MTEEELKVLQDLHDRGYAVCVFTPEELGPAPNEEVESAMAEAGWRQIDFEKESQT